MTKEQNVIQIKSAEIINFRGIKECKVDDLSLVNLFIGKNNSRKSTMLDAIFIACKETKKPSLIPIIKERVEREILPYEIFYGYDSNLKAEVKLNYTNGVNYSVSFTEAENEIEVTEGSKIERGQLYSYLDIDGDITYLVGYGGKTPKHFYYN
ncbi:MAG: AAA family ATPase, partial [Candidatus Methanoperedens sp.]